MASAASLSGSGMWEQVSLSPLELLAMRLDAELQQAEQERAAAARGRQNRLGVDLDAAGRAAGRLSVELLALRGLAPAPAQLEAQLEPAAFVTAMASPVSAFERSVKKHQRSAAAPLSAGAASWRQALVYDGVKSTTFSVRVAVHRASRVLADVALGEAELRSDCLLDQRPHELWLDLRAPGSPKGDALGQLLVRATFEYSAVARHDREIEALRSRKQENDINIDVYKQNAQLLNAAERHPAAFGAEPIKAALYIPGNRFRAEAHHPAAVQVAPLADKSRVVTPFGRGVVVSFRAESKMYVVQLDAHDASKNSTIAYLRQVDVKEEPDAPHFRMHMQVATPYGHGSLEEIRVPDGVMIVQTDYAKLFMQPKDVSVPAKTVNEMTTKDLIGEAVKLADEGNELFRIGSLDEAVLSYLRSLGFLQRVDQDAATHKEKATMLQTMIRCHLNISACKLRQDAYVDAEIASTNALSILNVLADNRAGNVVTWMGRLGLSDQLMFEDWPSKARFRRAQACAKQGKYVDAKQDLLVAVKLSPKDKSCRALLERVTQLLDKQKREEKKAWGGIFENISEDKQVTPEAIAHANLQKKVAASSEASGGELSIFTRKSKRQRELEKEREASEAATGPWYLSAPALAAASVVTAGVAAVALLALKPKSS